MEQFSATVFGPGDLGRQSAGTVVVAPDGLRVELPGIGTLTMAYDGLDLSRGGFDDLAIVVAGRDQGGQELSLHLADEEFLRALSCLGPVELRPVLARLRREGECTRRSWWRWGLALAACVVGGLLGLNLLAGAVAGLVPVAAEVSLGEAVADGLAGKGKVLSSGPAVEAVTGVWQAVSRGLPASPYAFRVRVVESPQVNALAAPGGQIVVFTGLVDRLESPEELAGILAHEAAHGLKRHGLRQIVKALGVSAVMAILIGDPGGLGRMARDLGSRAFLLSYSREDEREADRLAVDILRRASIDPSRFPEFFRRLGREEGLPEVLSIISTHPSHGERDRELRALMRPEDASRPRLAVPWPPRKTRP